MAQLFEGVVLSSIYTEDHILGCLASGNVAVDVVIIRGFSIHLVREGTKSLSGPSRRGVLGEPWGRID